MVERGADRRGRDRDDRGAAAVEFALVVLPLLLIVFGIIGYGFMLSFRQSISQAAAEGARAAAVAPVDLKDADLHDRARRAINDALASYDVTCDENDSDGDGETDLLHGSDPAGVCTIDGPETCTNASDDEQCVTVTLAYTYDDDPLVPDMGYGIVLPDTLDFSSEVRVS